MKMESHFRLGDHAGTLVADVQAGSEGKRCVIGRHIAADKLWAGHICCTASSQVLQLRCLARMSKSWQRGSPRVCKQQKEQSQEVRSHCAGLVTTIHTEHARLQGCSITLSISACPVKKMRTSPAGSCRWTCMAVSTAAAR